MAIDWQRIESVGLKLLQLAATAEGGPIGGEAVALVTGLLGVGTELNGLLKEVREQTDANAADVAAHVADDYNKADAAWLASVAAHAQG